MKPRRTAASSRTAILALTLSGFMLSGQNCGGPVPIDNDPTAVPIVLTPCGGGLIPAADSDFDKLCDEIDNCPFSYNPDQLDSDGNGVGNKCEAAPALEPLTIEVTAETASELILASVEASGGTAPYTYHWSANPSPSPAAFLDSAAADLIWAPPCGRSFVLTVTVSDSGHPYQLVAQSTDALLIPCP